MSKCGVPKCRYRRKRNGVCGVHRRWAYVNEPDNVLVPPLLKRLETSIDENFREAELVEAGGHDLLHAQHYLNANLTIPEQLRPSPFTKWILSMKQVVGTLKELQAVDGTGGHLGFALKVRYSHRFGPRPCTCFYCSLGN